MARAGGEAPWACGHLAGGASSRRRRGGGETRPGLGFRRPFAACGGDLLSTTLPDEVEVRWVAEKWSVGWRPPPTGCALELGASVLVCGGTACPGVQPAAVRRAGGLQVASSRGALCAVHRMVSVA